MVNTLAPTRLAAHRGRDGQYWIIDPEVRVLEILELGADGRYAIALTASEGTPPVPGCEELTLDLDSLWAELDRLLGAGEPPR